jgi:glyoxylate/hydroxypyruvate reductase A
MAFLLLLADIESKSWVKQLKIHEPQLDLRLWPNTGPVEEIDFVLAWRPPPGELARYPKLRCIASLGAGVDHLLRDPDLPAAVPVTRVVDASMAQSMSEYVVMAVLNWCRHMPRYARQQQERRWQVHVPRQASSTGVGIMGLGQLGGAAARHLVALGFDVAGWSTGPKQIAGVRSYIGEAQLGAFLGRTDILVCLLPLTERTRGILDARLFAGVRPGAYLINCARGEHLQEADLLAALDSGQLAGACLDVFVTEPLPPEHPFWRHPSITVTPHTASLTHPRAVVPRLIENYRRVMAGLAPLDQIDRLRGY